MGPLGWQETIFIFILALLVFGPKKLPELGKTIGKAMTEFRRASSELKSTWDREMHQMERENESIKEEARKIEGEISSSYGGDANYNQNYDNSYYDSGYEYGYGSDANNPGTADTGNVSASATQGADQTAQAADASATSETMAAAGGAASSTDSTTAAVAEGDLSATSTAGPEPGSHGASEVRS